jgi:Cu/Ag efflux protein CusF
MNIKFAARLAAALVLICSVATAGFAQANSKKKSYTLHGTIQAVKGSDGKVTVKHDKIEGYMGAMTMDYKVADADMLNKLKTGDEITATLYEDDYTLYNIHLMASNPKKQ